MTLLKASYFIKQLFLCVTFSLIYSCSNSNIGEENSPLKLRLIETKIFTLDNETPPYNADYQLTENGKKRTLSFLNARNKTLYFYDYDSRELINKIPFEAVGPNGVGEVLRSYYYHNQDSIFVQAFQHSKFYLFNSEGKKLNTYPLKAPLGNYITPFYYSNGKLVLNNSLGCNSSQGQDPKPVAAVYDLKSKAFTLDVDYPKEYYTENSGWPISLCNVSNAPNIESGTDLYSFAMSPKVIVTDHKGKIEVIDFSSSEIDQSEFETTDEMPLDPLDQAKLAGRYAQYGAIYYDPFRKYYLRFANGPIPESSMEKRIFKPIQNIIIKDENFNTIGEVKNFEGSHFFFFTKEGLNQISVDKDNEDLMVINVFDYEK